MRTSILVACLFAIVAVGLPVVSAQDQDDDGGDDAAPVGGANGMQLAQQVSDEYADSGILQAAGAANAAASAGEEDQASDDAVPVAGPTAPEPLVQLQPEPQAPVEAKDAGPVAVQGPATVSMATSLDNFGKQHVAAKGQKDEDAETAALLSDSEDSSLVGKDSLAEELSAIKADPAAKKPAMKQINIMRTDMCWKRENLWQHEKCLKFLGLQCSTASTGKGICTQFANQAATKCKTSTDAKFKDDYCAIGKSLGGKAGEVTEAKAATAVVADSKAAPTPVGKVATDAQNAHIAAETAKHAAKVANKIAKHSVHMTSHAKDALKDARDALHKARVESAGLSSGQKHDLKKAEAKLREATKSAEFGEVKNAKYVKAKVENKKLQKMEHDMDKIKKAQAKKKHDGELEAMRKEIDELRKILKTKEGDKAEDDALLKDLQDQIKEMEEADKKDDHKTQKSHDELKAEIERLRAEIKDMQDDEGKVEYKIPKKAAEEKVVAEEKEEEHEEVEKYKVNMKPLSHDEEQEEEVPHGEATPVESKGIDIDTAMPYGDLEPFGREDTAQELTEDSINQSNEMVDQLERAEVAEEKRSVFRALTRLRGAAITSFDGVARSQTGNIDEYNKIHQWRTTHPLHHLADEESDISKWAFPENAD